MKKAATVVIRIDPEVYDHILKHARPLVDTPNAVLRRLLHLKQTSSQGAAPMGRSSMKSSRRKGRRDNG